jgi:tryptophan 7-halogenase
MPIESVVIVGGGVAAWLAAASLARKTRCAITVVETDCIDDSLGLPLAVEATLPSISALHSALGIDQADVVRRTGSSFALGRALSNWTPETSAAFHGYGDVGAGMGPVGFQHLAARLRSAGDSLNLANYSVAALCAQAGRFAPPPSDMRSVLSTLQFGLHINIAQYREYLRQDAIAHGAAFSARETVDPVIDAQGLIMALKCDTGEIISGDLFLDCSGQSRLLASKMPNYSFVEWSQWLSCTRARISTSPAAALPVYAHIDAHGNGWHSFASTQTRLGELFVMQESAATDAYAFQSGGLANPWRGNCIAIGGAAVMLDPLASTQLHLAGSAILQLLKLFPHAGNCQIEAAEFNRLSREARENARDFVILHYKLNQRYGEAFWDDCRAMTIPDRLAHKIALYEQTGRIALHDEESFETWDWISAFDALGLRPKSYDAMADAFPKEQIEQHFAHVRAVMLKAVGTLPSHLDYLRAVSA